MTFWALKYIGDSDFTFCTYKDKLEYLIEVYWSTQINFKFKSLAQNNTSIVHDPFFRSTCIFRVRLPTLGNRLSYWPTMKPEIWNWKTLCPDLFADNLVSPETSHWLLEFKFFSKSFQNRLTIWVEHIWVYLLCILYES